MSKTIDGKEYLSLGEGLYQMSQKGIIGRRIRLTKKRAWVLRDMIKRLEDYVPEENSPRFNDYCATLEWMRQEINKRYSEFDLGTI